MSDAALSQGGFGTSVKSFGALGDGRNLDGPAIQAAIDAAGRNGGGEIVLPPGGYVSGSLFLRDGVALRLERGAALLGSRDPRDYPLAPTRWEGREVLAHSSLVGAVGARNVGVTGGGLIDGRGDEWWRLARDKSLANPRPLLLSFDRCETVVLDGFEARNSPSWTVRPLRSRNVSIRGLTVINPPDSPNTDGIDPDSCQNVRISDCYVSVGDDCIAIKAGAEAGPGSELVPCENVIVTNCVLERGHGGVVIGSEMSGGVRDVVVSACIFRGTDRGIRMKTRRGRGGKVEHVRVSGLVMEDTLCPFTINSHYGCGAWDDPAVADLGLRAVGSGTPAFTDIAFSSITATGARLAAAWIDGLAESPIRGLSFEDVSIELGGEAAPAPAEMSPNAPAISRAGFRAYNVLGLRLANVSIKGQSGPAYRLRGCPDARTYSCEPGPRILASRLGKASSW
jgi:polygalacturonase